ncbi:flagellar hook-associated family protein [Fulvimarina endophytica]|uniref:Flagellin n=1 Tax=Fulvimarina endophytica TaxID=2293836 RepID=A0A371X1A1_9HYPH|nr:flagellar hook-associated family protein [Fulvimarina endophytica]RFC63006.1 flagellar hook-associated family protein [Fulvimarina endophytica]
MTNFLVSSFSLSAAPRNSVSRIQQELTIAQKQVATGRFADVGEALGVTVGRTISMRAEMSNIEKLKGANTSIAQRFDTMQAVLETAAGSGENLMSSIISNGSTDEGIATNRRLALANIGQLVGVLNSSYGSRYLFGGGKTDTVPMKSDIVNDYATSQASGTVDTAWQTFVTANAGGDPSLVTADQMKSFLDNEFAALFVTGNTDPALNTWDLHWSNASSSQTQARIGESDLITTSASANDDGFRNMMKSYAMLANLSGESLSDEARQVLTSRSVETLSTGLSQVTDLRSEIGIGQERISRANDGLKAQTFILKVAIGKEEEVDSYEAAIRVTNLTNNLEASYALTARISRLSILNYL